MGATSTAKRRRKQARLILDNRGDSRKPNRKLAAYGKKKRVR